MIDKKVKKAVKGHPTVDGAGVHLTRVLGSHTVKDFDPWLMLDSFDSGNPDDFTAGFPSHPHRGIETITYLIEGEMEHRDSIGNSGVIHSGEAQWMTAGSGIIHEEMPVPAERMLGAQLWLNLPAGDKMSAPQYFSITGDMISTVITEFGIVRIIAGRYDAFSGVRRAHLPATILDVSLAGGREAEIPVDACDNTFLFLLEGSAIVDQQSYDVKSALLLDQGDNVRVAAGADEELRFLLCSAPPLGEEVAWGGPIVMNTQEELKLAFQELQEGTFLKHEI